MKPRILFLAHSGALGGAELYLIDVARHYVDTSRVVLFEDGPLFDKLVREGIRVEVVSAPAALHEVNKVDGLLQGLKALPGVARLVLRIARVGHSYDLIFANSQKALVVGALAGRLAGRPVIWNLHDILTAEHFSRFNRRMAVRLSNLFVDRVIVNSNATNQAFIASGGHGRKSGVVYNGIAAAPFDDVSHVDVSLLRNALGLVDVPVVGVFGRLTPWKGQHVLLHALTQVPDAHAIVVGDALFGADGLYRDQLYALSEELGIQDRVHFLGFREDVCRLLTVADIIVHTSVAPEPFGRVIVEGMLAARPVVATRAGGVLEILEDGRTGLLVPPEDPEALAEALRWLLAHPSESRSIAASARRRAEDRFSPASMLRQIEDQIAIVAPTSPHLDAEYAR